MNCFSLYIFLGENCIGNVLTKKETYWMYIACSAIAALFQIRHSQQRVIGASGAVMGFIVLESFLLPFQHFMLLFPFPGMTLSSIQIAQFTFILNAFFTLWNRYHQKATIAWYGHLIGMGVAGLYAEYCRHIIKDSRFQHPLPSIQDSVNHW